MPAGEDLPSVYGTDEDPDGEFHLRDTDTWDETRTVWLAEIETARANAAKFGLDALSLGRSERGESFNLRWICTHMIEEYARRNEHADLLRERIDGAAGT